MNRDTRITAAAALVAFAGGVMAFLVLTDRGRHVLRRVGPTLNDVSDSFEDIRSIAQKLDRMVREASALVTDFRDVTPSTRGDDDLEHPPYRA